MAKSLLVVPESIKAIDVFCNDKAESIVASIENDVRSFVPDVSTKKSRDEISSLAYKVSRSKTALDNLGKELCAEWKKNSKGVDNERKFIRDRLDKLRDEIKEPLVKWENEAAEKAQAEAARIEIIENEIARINGLCDGLLGADSTQIQAAIDKIVTEGDADFFAEFTEAAELAKMDIRNKLTVALGERVSYEKTVAEKEESARKMAEQQAELDKKQADIDVKEAEIARAEREEEIKNKAAHQAKIEAEHAAQEKINSANLAEENARLDAEKAIREAAQLVEEEKANAAEKIEAVRREAKEKAAKEKADADAREADKSHKRAINTAAVNELMAGGVSETAAKKCITLIAQKKIPAVKINY